MMASQSIKRKRDMTALEWLSLAITGVFTVIRFFITLPYQRLLIYNTVRPAQEVQKLASQSLAFQFDTTQREELWAAIAGWRTRKRDELSFVAVAAAAMTAIITASLSWPNVEKSHWTGPAFWYASLSLCISAIFLSSQQLSLLSLIEKKGPSDAKVDGQKECDMPSSTVIIRRHLEQILNQDRKGVNNRSSGLVVVEAQASEERDLEKAIPNAGTVREVSPPATGADTGPWVFSWHAIYVWQCSIMLIAYSTVFYLVGLSVVVCTPVLEVKKWGPDSYIAVAYMVSLGVSVWLFGFCSYGAYDYIYEGDNANRTFVQELVRRVRILSDGKDPMKRRRSALLLERDIQ